MTKNEEKKSKFGRRKFIGHAVRDDPNIDLESTRPVEKRRLKTTREEALITQKSVPKTQLKEIHILVAKKPKVKINKPLRQAIPWKLLEREIKVDKKRRERRRNK